MFFIYFSRKKQIRVSYNLKTKTIYYVHLIILQIYHFSDKAIIYESMNGNGLNNINLFLSYYYVETTYF